VFTDRKNPAAGPAPRLRACAAPGAAGGSGTRRDRPVSPAGRAPPEAMKKLGAILGVIVLALVLSRVRDRAVHSVSLTHTADAVQRARGVNALDEKRQLDMLANPAPDPGRAQADAIDRSPFHFLALSPSGRYVTIAGPLTFRAGEPVRLILEIHPALVAEDMPDPLVRQGEPNRPDLRIANTSFEVLADENGAARAVPFRADCRLAPEPSDIAVSLELGGNHDARDEAERRIRALELAGRIGPADARAQLAALNQAYAPNAKGAYRVRAVYRQGRLATEPITLIITD